MAERSPKITLQDTLAQQSEKKERRSRADQEEKGGLHAFFAWLARLSLLFVICSSPWMIASVNPGAQLIIAIVLLLGVACWWIDTGLSASKRHIVPYVAVFVILGMGIGYFQTMKLSQGIADLTAGRQVEIAEKYLAVAGAETAPPIRLSMDVEGTWYQLRLLVIALTSLLLGSQYFRTAKHLSVLLGTILINGVALTAFGLVQKFRFNGKLFWEIELTQGGTPFGPFVCRNNAAGYLVMCIAAGAGLLLLLMTKKEASRPHQIVSKEIPFWRQVSTYLMMFIAELDAKRIAVIIGCVFVSIGVVATLSRGGVVALLTAWIGGAIIYNLTRKPKFAGVLMLPLAVLVIGLASWVGFADDVLARFERIDTLGESTINARLDTWRDTLPAAYENGWFGAGLGTYRSVHRLYRSNTEKRLFIYAENQYVQSLVEAGIPGLCLLVCALILAFWYIFFLLTRGNSGVNVGAGVFGAFLLSGQAIAAVFDFGWYIPANMVLLAAGVGAVGFHAHSLAGRLKKKTWLRFEIPSIVQQGLILGVFLLGIFVVYDLFNKSAIYNETKPASMALRDPQAVDLDETNLRIGRLKPLVEKSPTSVGLNMLGDLYLHRARLQYYDLLRMQTPMGELGEEEKTQVQNNLWNLTSLVRVHEYQSALGRENENRLLQRFRQQDFMQLDLPQALICYRRSQQAAYLQPRTQLMIGALRSILQDFDNASQDLEKSLELSPKNPDFRFTAAMIFLQHGDSERGALHLGEYLNLKPNTFSTVVDIATGKSSRQIETLDSRLIFEQVLGKENPNQLYRFAKSYVGDDPRLKTEILETSNALLTDISLSDTENLKLKANVNFESGNVDDGIKYLASAVRSNPNDQPTRLQLARALLDNERFEDAREHAEKLLRINSSSSVYRKLFRNIQEKIEESKGTNDELLGAEKRSLDSAVVSNLNQIGKEDRQ